MVERRVRRTTSDYVDAEPCQQMTDGVPQQGTVGLCGIDSGIGIPEQPAIELSPVPAPSAIAVV